MQIIPVSPVPSQSFRVTLGGQNCTISLYQKSTGMFIDVLVNNVVIIAGVLCLDRTKIVRDSYLGFAGELFWFDTQGTSDPFYPDLGSRYLLAYLAAGGL